MLVIVSVGQLITNIKVFVYSVLIYFITFFAKKFSFDYLSNQVFFVYSNTSVFSC